MFIRGVISFIVCFFASATTCRPAVAWNGECMISGADLAQWRTANDSIVVDTRPAAEFRRVRVPGSINLPAKAVKTKAYLKDRATLLVGRTGRGNDLEPICEELREAGFTRVGVIQGGLNYWAAHGGALTGRGRRDVDRMSPADFSRAASDGGWLVIDVSAPAPASAPFPELARSSASSGQPEAEAAPLVIVQLPFQTGAESRTDIEAAIANHAGEATFVLVTDRDGRYYERIARELEPLAIEHLYFLTGGLDGYRRYKEQQRQIGESMARGCTLNECGAP